MAFVSAHRCEARRLALGNSGCILSLLLIAYILLAVWKTTVMCNEYTGQCVLVGRYML